MPRLIRAEYSYKMGITMIKWPWIERKFSFDYPVSKWPDLLERTRGAPACLEERVRGLSQEVLTYRPPDGGWSIKTNIGHLADVSPLFQRRIEQILAGESKLVAADMSNPKSNTANHDATDIEVLLAAFRAQRAKIVAKYESLDPGDWGKSALHPRLNQPMRIVDIAYFDSEHDDYHLGRIGELIRAASKT